MIKRLPLLYGFLALICAGLFAKPACSQSRDMRLFLLMGQSNMAGQGVVEPQDEVTDTRIWKLNKTMNWEIAKEPVHFDRPTTGVGPAMAFAREIVKADPGGTVGLIPCAVSGKSMDQWKEGGLLYNNAVARTRAAMANGKLAGILWHQGEADRAPNLVFTYPSRFSSMITQLRKDLNAPNVPVLVGEIGRFRSDQDYFNSMLPGLVRQIPRCGLVSAVGLMDKGDNLHFSSAAQRVLGKRYAEAFLKLDGNHTTTPPKISVSDANVKEGDAGTINVAFTVNLSYAYPSAVTVKYVTADGTAKAGEDYNPALLTSLTFAPGEISKTVNVAVRGDLLREADETFQLKLSAPVNGTLDDSVGTGTIVDDDANPTLSIDDVNVTEGNSGLATAKFSVRLSEASSQTITVKFATADGTAKAGTDYNPLALSTLSFAPGQTLRELSVAVNGDVVDELNEDFSIKLSTATNAIISKATGVGRITDDDTATISATGTTITEGNSGTPVMNFALKLSTTSDRTVSVLARTATAPTVPAEPNADYVAFSAKTYTIPAGQTSATVPVTIKGDLLNEADEKVALGLSFPVNTTIATELAIGTIRDDDALPELRISNATVTEGLSGTKNVPLTVTLSPASGQTVTVKYATARISAMPNVDYVALPRTILTFAPGETTKTIYVAVKGDTLVEGTEKFSIVLLDNTASTLIKDTGVITIKDAASALVAKANTHQRPIRVASRHRLEALN